MKNRWLPLLSTKWIAFKYPWPEKFQVSYVKFLFDICANYKLDLTCSPGIFRCRKMSPVHRNCFDEKKNGKKENSAARIFWNQLKSAKITVLYTNNTWKSVQKIHGKIFIRCSVHLILTAQIFAHYFVFYFILIHFLFFFSDSLLNYFRSAMVQCDYF